MKKNKILENISLFTAGAKGVAIGRSEEGKTIIVSGAVPGDVVNVRVKKSKSKYIEGEVADILEYSEDLPEEIEPTISKAHDGQKTTCNQLLK